MTLRVARFHADDPQARRPPLVRCPDCAQLSEGSYAQGDPAKWTAWCETCMDRAVPAMARYYARNVERQYEGRRR
jgi:hypothetical protein